MLRVKIGRPAAKALVTLPAGLTQMGVALEGSLSEPAAQNRCHELVLHAGFEARG
jgi:hypothetical protein